MTCKIECTQFELAMELLIENGFDGIADIYYWDGSTYKNPKLFPENQQQMEQSKLLMVPDYLCMSL
jgi:hypothetical protein